jgi:hypothetical protein
LNGCDDLGKKNKKNSDSDVESLDSYDFEDEGFLDGDVEIEDAIATFSFGSSDNLSTNKVITATPVIAPPQNDAVESKENFYIPNARCFTPSIDGEAFSVKRGYQLRPSTLIKLHELKNKHPDANVYLNTILDAAILHFYNYIFNENGSF